jgi:hypothetical protein
VTVSATSLTPALTATPTTLLGVLADASATAAQMHSEVEISQVNSAIQNRLNAQVAALQTTPDTAVVNALQTQITALQKQSSLYSNVGSQFGANANILSDLQNQLATMQTAASGGDLRYRTGRREQRCRRPQHHRADGAVPTRPGDYPPGQRARHQQQRHL